MTRLSIPIDHIKAEGLFLDCEESPENFPVLFELSKSRESEFHSPIKISLCVNRIYDMIKVEGKFETRVHLTCSRCLNEFETILSNRFETAYVQDAYADNQKTVGEEIELSRDELHLIPFRGEELDLRSTIQEQVVLTLPMRMLCRKDCRGLCSRCGVDLNAGSCGCQKDIFTNKFEALKDFKVEKS
jgi:uncharacterized protein